jgi:hypothetical protein
MAYDDFGSGTITTSTAGTFYFIPVETHGTGNVTISDGTATINLSSATDEVASGHPAQGGSITWTFSSDNFADHPSNVSATESGGNNGNGCAKLNLVQTGYQSSTAILFEALNGGGHVDGYYLLSSQPLTGSTSVTLENGGSAFDSLPCYAAGTLILTPNGEVPVESLKAGDLVVTASGAQRPVHWIGHRRINCLAYPTPTEAWPVRISAGAFGANRPSRDLFVSPGHAIAVTVVDEVLIPASHLINGTTIQQQEVDEVTYWHVELETPDILVADGLPAESYIDVGNRGFFLESEGNVSGLLLSETAPAGTGVLDHVQPRVMEGEIVKAVRARLAARSRALGWMLAPASLASFHALVDGRRVDPQVHQGVARFLIPADAKELRLVSSVSAPIAVEEDSLDPRNLGVYLEGLAIDDGLTGRREIALDDPRLTDGLWALERDAHGVLRRWTRGNTPLPTGLWEGCLGMFFLQVAVDRSLPHWVAPASAASEVEACPQLRLVSGA